jgi:hypothetical protein
MVGFVSGDLSRETHHCGRVALFGAAEAVLFSKRRVSSACANSDCRILSKPIKT